MRLATGLGPMVAGQSTAAEGAMGARLEDVPGDSRLTDLHDVGSDALHHEPFVRRIESLLQRTSHARTIVARCTSANNPEIGWAIGGGARWMSRATI